MACVKQRNGRLVLDFYDQHNKRVVQRLPEGTTKGRAQKKLAEIIMQLEKGNFIPKKSVPTFQKVSDDWLKVKVSNIRHTTFAMYEGYLKHYLLPHIGALPINRVTVTTIEKLVPQIKADYPEKRMIWDAQAKYRNNTKLQKQYPTLVSYIAYRKDQGFNMDAEPAPATFKKILIVAGQVLKFAVKRRIIDHNPVTLAEKPKMKNKRDADFLQPAEIRGLLDKSAEGKYRTIFLMAVFTGLRQGELLGLKWDDIDWLNKQVCVNRTYNHGKFMEPKSKTSYRRVDLAPIVVEELKKWKLACPLSEHNLVFATETGNPIDAMNMLHKGYYPTLRRTGLRRINFHGLRHTYASLQIANDVNLKYLQQQMGHASINITLDTYGHLLKSSNQYAAVKLENAIFENAVTAEAKQA
jgi:integrase